MIREQKSNNNTSIRTNNYTRRQYLKSGATLIGGGLLTGCINNKENRKNNNNTQSIEETSYSVSMSPVGRVNFEDIPSNVYTGLPNTADMVIAAGRGDTINSIYFPEYHGTLLNHFYAKLEDVSLNWKDIKDSWGLGKEGFYELDSDVHLTDPAYASTLDNLKKTDIEEIRKNIGPWFGNYYSNTHSNPPENWTDNYQYYTLWEIFKKVAKIFKAERNYQVLYDEYKNLISTIQSRRPPSSERPTVALTFPTQDSIGVFHLNSPGFLAAHTRPLGAIDAFSGMDFEQNAQIGMEAMAKADPDIILTLFRFASSYSVEETRNRFQNDPVGQTISAVQKNQIYAQGIRYQGPITNLFQLEMAAKQVYPDQFGGWPGYVDGEDYPEISEDEQLFDRHRISEIIKK